MTIARNLPQGATPSDIQRVYHFVELKYGLDDLKHRRLKIAELQKLNDPFEFLGANLSNPELRRAFIAMKNQMATNRGILCFSRDWRNPVQWSHYAERHTGLCLGFDVPSRHLADVNYSRKRFAIEVRQLLKLRELDSETAKRLLFTKYSHWRYENEIRAFLTLDETDPETGLYFADFSDSLKLVEVIMGASCSVTKSDLLDALGDLQGDVSVTKARLAFGSFRVVLQRNKHLWWEQS